MEMTYPDLHTDSTYGKEYGRRMTRTKHDLRSEATRRRLVTAARTLFGARGFADVGTEEVVRAAGVTRGALYHQFRDKADLFAAVAEEVEAEIAERIASTTGVEAEPVDALRTGARLFLDACAAPEVERIILLDAPAVLGWEAWRDLTDRYGLGLVQFGLQSAIEAGAIVPQPVAPLAHVLIGALNESALYVARAEDPVAAREQCVAIIDRILHGLMTSA
jgi:AcrR family transcriptional regulator